MGNLHEVAPGSANRQYSAGGKLVRRGDVEYTYDNEGRLTRKHTVTASGASSAWTYEWNGRGLLSAVNTPTGSRVQFEYDPFARRIEKSVVSREGVRDRTRFVYDVDSLLHEIRDRLAEDGERIVEERTYTFEPGGLAAIAHQDTTLHGNQRVVSPRVYYVNGGGAFAERLLSGEGHVISRAPHGVWGDVGVEGIGTPLRFAGQYADEETGLAYNRNRYYEAESGRYISRDPIGLEGGLRIFGYAGNRPSALIDPEGLVAVIATTTSNDGVPDPPPQSSGGMAGDLHPVVAAALPPTAGGIYPSYVTGNDSSGKPNVKPGRPPEMCAEPRALSERMRAYETANGLQPNSLKPDTEADRAHIQKALGGMKGISAREEGENGKPRAPCSNCSQLLANLGQTYNVPMNGRVADGGGPGIPADDPANFTPPNTNWAKAQNQAMSGINPGQSTNPMYVPETGY